MKQNSTAEDAEGVVVEFRDGVLCVQLCDGAGVDAVLAAYERLLSDKRFSQDMNAIWDLSNLDLTAIALGEIRRLATSMRGQMQRRGSGFKAALVTRRRVDFHLLRTYLAVLRLIGDLQLRAFDSNAKAEAWLHG